jgi:cytochrome c biogenesis factor
MVPTGWVSVLLFLLLVAPGLAFELLSEKRRAAYVESTFREISRLVLGIIGFTALGLVFLAIVRTIWRSEYGKGNEHCSAPLYSRDSPAAPGASS